MIKSRDCNLMLVIELSPWDWQLGIFTVWGLFLTVNIQETGSRSCQVHKDYTLKLIEYHFYHILLTKQ